MNECKPLPLAAAQPMSGGTEPTTAPTHVFSQCNRGQSAAGNTTEGLRFRV